MSMLLVVAAVVLVLVLAGGWWYMMSSDLSAETKIAWNTTGDLFLSEAADHTVELSTTGTKFRFDGKGHVLSTDGKRMLIALGTLTHSRLVMKPLGKKKAKDGSLFPDLSEGQSLLKYDATLKEIQADPATPNVVNAYAAGTVFMGPDAGGARTWRKV